MLKPTHWPHLLRDRESNFTVTVYRRDFTKTRDRKTYHYEEFKFAYRENGKRKFRTAPTWEKIQEAVKDMQQLLRADGKDIILSGDARAIYTQAIDALKSCGVPLNIVARDYADAYAMLRGASLAEAVKYYQERHAVECGLTVQQVVDEFIASLEGRKVKRPGERYLEDLRSRLDKFATALSMRLDSVTPEHVGAFLNQFSGRTRFNCQRIVKTLFNYARKRKYVAKDFDEFENVETGFDDDREISIFTPEEMSRLLSVARPEMIPFLAIGAFAGVRTKEICRLDWSDLVGDQIYISAAKSKTRQPRCFKMRPNLLQWLEAHRKERGPIVPFANIGKQQARTARAASVKWKHNSLRHSFASYRYSITQNARTVIFETGHTEQQFFKSYRKPAAKSVAEAWFAIAPKNTEQGPPATKTATP